MKKTVTPAAVFIMVVLAAGILALAGGSIYIAVTAQKAQVSITDTKSDGKKSEQASTQVLQEEEEAEFKRLDGFQASKTGTVKKSDGKSDDSQEADEKCPFPDSDTEALSKQDVESLKTEDEVRNAINYIYACAGRIFNDADIQSYYESQDWYEGLYTADEMDADVKSYLTDIQYKNVQLLTERRKKLK